MTDDPELPWRATVRLDDVHEGGRKVRLEPDEATRAAVAKAANVDGIDGLVATFELTRHGRDGLRAVGQVKARVRQTCVVSLEPLLNPVDEPIDVTFAPPREPVARPKSFSQKDDDDEMEMLLESTEGDDEPEPLLNGTVDLGALAFEFLMLGIDPYPRKADVAFAPPAGRG